MTILHQDATYQTRRFVTVWIFGLWFFFVIKDPFPLISGLPISAVDPVGILGLLPQSFLPLLFNAASLWILKISLLYFSGAVIFNFYPKISATASCILITVYSSLLRSFGLVDHTEIGLIFAAYLLTLFSLADSWTKNRPYPHGAPLVAVVLSISFLYTFIGSHRLVHGGWETFTSDTLLYWIIQTSSRVNLYGWQFEGLVFQYPVLACALKIGYFVCTIFEILAPLALFYRRFRYAFITVIAGFHITILLFMHILFLENLLLLILFFDLTRWLAPAKLAQEERIIFFDGVCVLCNGFADWVLKDDTTGVYKLAAIQGETAKKDLGEQAKDPMEWSIILKDETGISTRSTAVLKIVSNLGGIGKLAAIFLILPSGLRDAVYKFVARNRYRWFGKRDSCRIPMASEAGRILK